MMPNDPFMEPGPDWEGPAAPGRKGLGCAIVGYLAACALVVLGTAEIVWGWPW